MKRTSETARYVRIDLEKTTKERDLYRNLLWQTIDKMGKNPVGEYVVGDILREAPQYALTLKGERDMLVARMKETATLAYELMERAQTVDRKLLASAYCPDPGCELGEITRLRSQLNKNNNLLETLT